MFKTANEVVEAIRKREEEKAKLREAEYEKIREQIEDVIEGYINGDDSEMICHFKIPEEIQQELVAAGYLVLHFVEGLGYDAYVLRCSVLGGIGELKDFNKE